MHAGRWAFVGRTVAVGALFLLHLLLARLLTPETYGHFLIVYSLVVVHAVLAGFGLPRTVLRLIREGLTHGDAAGVRACLGRATRAVAGCIVASCGIFSVVVLGFGERLFGADLSAYWVWGVFLVALSALRQLAAEVFRGFEDFRWSALLGAQQGGVAQHVIALGCLGGLATFSTVDLHVVFLLMTIAVVVPLFLAAPRIFRLYDGLAAETSATTAAKPPHGLLSQSAPILASNMALIGLKHFDILVVGALVSPGDLAVYGVAKKLITLVATPLLMGNMAMSSFIPELNVGGRLRELERLVRGTATLAALPTLCLLAALALAPGFFLEMCFGHAYRAGSTVLLILGAGYLFSSISGSCATTLVMTGRQKLSMSISLGATTLYVLAAPPAVLQYGITGAAVAMATSLMVKNLAGLAMVRIKVGIWSAISLSPTFVLDVLGTAWRNGKPVRVASPRRHYGGVR